MTPEQLKKGNVLASDIKTLLKIHVDYILGEEIKDKGIRERLRIFVSENVAELENEFAKLGASSEAVSTSIERLGLSVRSINCLQNAKIETLGELIENTRAGLLKCRHFGRKSLAEIETMLHSKGLRLKQTSSL